MGEVDRIATVMLIAAIPLLALRKCSGWWLAFIAALSVLLIDGVSQIIRTKTMDYLYGTIIAAALVVTIDLKTHFGI